jgi:hypothetical protein
LKRVPHVYVSHVPAIVTLFILYSLFLEVEHNSRNSRCFYHVQGSRSIRIRISSTYRPDDFGSQELSPRTLPLFHLVIYLSRTSPKRTLLNGLCDAADSTTSAVSLITHNTTRNYSEFWEQLNQAFLDLYRAILILYYSTTRTSGSSPFQRSADQS